MSPHFEAENAPTAVDLFSGCGGATYGLMNAGFEVRAAWEVERNARYTYHVHHCEPNGVALHGDATDIRPAKVPDDLDLLFAGPECQGFSAAGGDIDPDDPRNEHLVTVVDWVAACQPKLVAIENVRGLTELHGPLHEAVVSKLDRAGPGYRVETVELDAAAYGVPQRRSRVFILGARSDFGAPGQWSPPRVLTTAQPELTDFDGDAPTRGCRTAREAIDDLPTPLQSLPPAEDPIHTTVGELRPYVTGDRFARHYADPHSTPGTVTRDGEEVWLPPNHVGTDHDESTRHRMASWPHGFAGNSVTKRRLAPNEPSPTVTVSNGTAPVHYQGPTSPLDADADVSNVRRLTVREVARLQSFPDCYTFTGTKTDQFRQVGNAAPPLLVDQLARHLREAVLDVTPTRP